MAEGLTRYELGIIKQMHDEQHYKCVNQEYLAQQLRRIDLPPNVSRFDLAEKVRELERKISERE
ncbi:hypothetical protein J4443_03410 [Candidatus Woesearchaeota archaeon]|nr:hypothetical protein [Candidatus Woesearchaeota archaeon]